MPRELTSFVGRQDQIDEVSRALRTAGLMTLTGTGGVGKTRLALHVAATVQAQYAYGAWLVELAPVNDPVRVPAAVAHALGVRERPGVELTEVLSLALARRQMLLVLDNCEHVLQATAELVSAMLQTCENLSVLATSREALGVSGEVVYSVPPLSIASPDDSFERLIDCDAVRLLVARIQTTKPSFVMTETAAPFAARVCHLVDGLPLGIELAASRARSMSLPEIVDRLSDPLSLLTVGPRTAPRRQQTLRATIDWSYALLTEAQRRLLRGLATFSDGCTFDGVEAVCGDPDTPASDLSVRLDRLVGHSLVIADTRNERTRFTLLQTVRQYCLERVQEARETGTFRDLHRDWCLQLVADSRPEAFEAALSQRLMPDLENLRTAFRWSLESGQIEAATRIALGMTVIWHLRGSFSEGRSALSAVFERASAGNVSADVINAGTWAATMAVNEGDYFGADEILRRVVDLAPAARDASALLFAENQRGWVAFMRGDTARARKVYERTFQVVSRTTEPLHLVSRYQLALACIEQDDRIQAEELLENFLDLVGASRSGLWPGRLAYARALLAEQAGDYAMADRLFEEAITAERAIDDQPGLLRSLTLRGAVAAAHGNRRVASVALAEALEVGELHASKIHIAHLLEAMANLMLPTDLVACVRLAGAAAHLRTVMGAAPAPTEKARLGRYLEVARQRIGERAYAELWRDAQSMSLTSVLTLVHQLLATMAEAPLPLAAAGLAETLSEREREVAILVTRGYSNREIAEELVISLKTAEAHIHHILNKLGLSNRVQIATWGTRHGVAAPDRQMVS